MKYIILLSTLLLSFHLANAKKVKQPNIILINCDDLGYGDLSCYDAEGYHTPAIDEMAENGIRFTDFSVSSPLCTPSRAALLTGRYPQRWGYKGGVYFPNRKDGMPQSEITIAEMLKEQGYVSAAIGKWHLGHLPEYLPTSQGFDTYFGIPYSNDMWQDGDAPLAKDAQFLEGMSLENYKTLNSSKFDKTKVKQYRDLVPLVEGTKVIEWPVDQSQITRRFTEKAVEFIEKEKDRPFFLYLAHSMPHVPLFASAKFKGITERGLYGDVIEEIDWSVDEILHAVKDNGISEKTIIIFTSDNGPWLAKKDNGGSSGELRGGKMTTYEGGIRVPFIIYWEGIIPQGQVYEKHLTSLDLLPSIAKITGATVPNDRTIDGFDVSKMLLGKSTKASKRPLFVITYGKNDNAVRLVDWKYRYGCVTDIPNKNAAIEEQLFKLNEDPNEQNNIAKEDSVLTKRFKNLLKESLEYIKEN